MSERKMTVYYESIGSDKEDELFEVIHKFLCPNPEDESVECPVYAATWQDVVEEES